MIYRTPEEKRARRRTRTKRIAITVVVALVLFGGLGAAVLVLFPQIGDRVALELGWKTDDYEGDGHGETTIAIVPGEIGEDIAVSLKEAGVVKTSEAFYNLLLEQDPQVEFLPGMYTLRLEMSSQSALDMLQDPANRTEYKAVVREGLTVAQTLPLLSAGAQIPLADFEAAAANPAQFGLPEGTTTLEGWLYPATFEFDAGSTAVDVLTMVIGHQIALLDELGVAPEDRTRVLTQASIVEKEAGRAEDYGKVARVISNRIEQGMRLEMDSTAQFGYGQQHDGSVWSSDEALADDNPWNTYVHEGLPISPIASPGRAAIEATLNPEPGSWIYFAAVNLQTGESAFSTTLEEHEAAVAQLNEWCLANPGNGC